MTDTVLVLNCGSSSIKYDVIVPGDGTRVAAGVLERIGEGDGARLSHRHGDTTTERDDPVGTHVQGLQQILRAFDELGPPLGDAGVVAVGHRVVMGGGHFDRATLIDDAVLATIDDLTSLAPLHNPPALAGIAVARDRLPHLPHVAVFDTAFFSGLPAAAATYALPRALARAHSIRRYGAHGTSHRYVAHRVAEVLGRDVAELRQVVLHLGNGASAAAVAGGTPVDTSMGFTPLEGLVMGTRSGDLDPAVVLHLARHAGLDLDQIDDVLNRQSGLRGLAGVNDLRELHRRIAEGDADARLALDVYVHRLRKYVGAYAAIMGGLDALTFTAGVGEHDATVRAATADGLGFLGIEVDLARNAAPSDEARTISPDGAPVTVLVVPTDEARAIAQEAMALVAER